MEYINGFENCSFMSTGAHHCGPTSMAVKDKALERGFCGGIRF